MYRCIYQDLGEPVADQADEIFEEDMDYVPHSGLTKKVTPKDLD